ncbi:hypothetical protein ALC62_04725 [Cyphomyrmex costatus]|uniref:Uncharacterized protein n=1 Tax=Cyphomyrmex costatus TaxID=456900 RepID=A0A195CV46_9HYME|nr:hypothetical protein ALC62_04725 [Cyphomyrmex costatus]
MLMASGGAAPLLTDGLIRGGGFITFSIISARQAKCLTFRFSNIVLTRTRSVSKDNLKDQSSLISSWTSTSSREPLEQYSDTRQGLVGSLRHPIRGLRFSCRSPWICSKVETWKWGET